jgi:hypothetical protein
MFASKGSDEYVEASEDGQWGQLCPHLEGKQVKRNACVRINQEVFGLQVVVKLGAGP